MRASRMCVAVALLAAAGVAHAQVIYSTGFESPTFAPGSINGQGGWVNGSSAGATQSISGAFARSGSQSLQWDNSAAVSFYSVRRPFDGQDGAISAATPLEISTWLYITPNTQSDRLYGIYANNTGTGTLGTIALGMTIGGDGTVRAGTAWVDTYSGAGLFQDAALVGDWVRLVLTYDGTGGSAAIFDSANNNLFSTNFAAVSLANTNANGASTWGVNLGSDYNALTNRAGIGYMDDFEVRIIPAPGTALALTVGLLAATRRRR